MRFGICAISTILPKFLRSLLRPVKERVIRILYGQQPLLVPGGGNQQFQTNGKRRRPPGWANQPRGAGERNMHDTAVFQSATLLTSTRPSRRRLRAAS